MGHGERASIDIAAMTSLVRGIESGLATLRSAKSSLESICSRVAVDAGPAARIGTAAQFAESAVPGLRRRLALAIHIEGQRAGGFTHDVVEIYEGDVSTMPPAEARQLGRDAATQLRDSHGAVPLDVIDLITANEADPYFAQGFAQTISPLQLTDVVSRESAQRQLLLQGMPMADEIEAYDRQYTSLLDAIGETLGTATRGRGDLALPGDYVDQWKHLITDPTPVDGGDGRYEGPGVASLLLSHGVYDADFLVDLTTHVYDVERSHHGDAVWGPRVNPQGYFGIYGPGGGQVYDPMSGLMQALGQNPDAAQRFLGSGATQSVDVGDDKVDVNDRLHYLLTERVWPGDGGNGLGEALEAATVYYRNHGQTGWTSAQIAAQTILLAGQKSGDGSDGGFLGLGADDGWQVPAAMTDSVGTILASYVPDVFRVANSQTGGDPVGVDGAWVFDGAYPTLAAGQPYGIRIGHDDLGKVLAGLGRGDDKTGIQRVVAAGLQLQVDTTDLVLRQARAQDPTAPLTLAALERSPLFAQFNRRGIDSAVAMAFIVNQGFRGGDSKQSLDQENRQALADVFGMATSLVPTPAGKISGFLTAQAESRLEDAIAGDGSDRNREWADGLDATVRRSLEFQSYNVLAANGYLDVATDPANGLPPSVVGTDAHGQRTIIPAIYQPGTGAADPTAVDDFNAWYQAGAPREVIEPFLLGPYHSSFPVFGS